MNHGVKFVCDECDWHGLDDDRLVAPNPFNSSMTIYGCPACKEVDCCRVACDQDDCWEPAACGAATPDGYRSTCSKHRPKEAAKAEEAHGVSCEKVPHDRRGGGYGHEEEDNHPYLVDRVWYCGRCHRCLSARERDEAARVKGGGDGT